MMHTSPFFKEVNEWQGGYKGVLHNPRNNKSYKVKSELGTTTMYKEDGSTVMWESSNYVSPDAVLILFALRSTS
jgi:hypothetical protein